MEKDPGPGRYNSKDSRSGLEEYVAAEAVRAVSYDPLSHKDQAQGKKIKKGRKFQAPFFLG